MATKKCPVCTWEIKDEGKTVEVDGEKITVCCDDCADQLRSDPRKYVTTS